ncbi:MAG: Crp/Fnr family transcriptional regulator, partial [Anaerolineae bacterium]
MSLKSILKGIPLFKNLTDEDLKLVASRLHQQSYPKGTILFNEGDRGDAMYLVESGQLTVIGQEGEERIATIGPGNFVGDIVLLLPQPRTATVEVTIDARLWLLSKKDFDDLIASRPGIALEMMRELSRRLVTTTRRKRQLVTRRITALSGGDKGLALSEAIHNHLKSPVALLPLPQSGLTGADPQQTEGVMFLSGHNLTEASLAESLSHQIEVYKHVVVILPDTPDSLARKAIDLADTVVCIDSLPDWLSTHDGVQELWVTGSSQTDLSRTARKLVN